MTQDYNSTYNEEYYSHYGFDPNDTYLTGRHIQTLHDLADILIRLCHPKSILDVGCAMNAIIKHAVDEYKIDDALGVDVSEYAFHKSFIPEKQKVLDISRPFNLGRKFDLVTCIETVEHLHYADAMVALDNIVAHASKYIYFTSTPYNFDDPTHITVLPTDVWVSEFEKRGFVYMEDYIITPNIEWGIFLLNKELL